MTYVVSSATSSGNDLSSYDSATLPRPLRWEECTTMDKKIGFVVGQAIPIIVKGAWKGVVFVVKLVPLDKAVAGCDRLSRQILSSCPSATIYIPMNNVCPRLADFCSRFFNTLYLSASASCERLSPCMRGTAIVLDSCTESCRPVAEICFRAMASFAVKLADGSVFLYHRISPYVARAAAGCAQSCTPIVEHAGEQVAACVNQCGTVVCLPVARQASAILQVCAERGQSLALTVFKNVLVPANDYLLSPFCNWVIIPTGTRVQNFAHALFSGCFGNPEPELDENERGWVRVIDIRLQTSISVLEQRNSVTCISQDRLLALLRHFGIYEAYRSATETIAQESGGEIYTILNLPSEKREYENSLFNITYKEGAWVITRHLKTE